VSLGERGAVQDGVELPVPGPTEAVPGLVGGPGRQRGSGLL